MVAEVGEEQAVLGVAQPAGRLAVRRVAGVAPGQGDGPGGEEAGDTVLAGPAVDMAQVVRLGEGPERLVVGCRPPPQVLVEQPLPGGGVDAGGVGEDAIGVEHDGLQAVQGEGGPAMPGHAGVLSPTVVRGPIALLPSCTMDSILTVQRPPDMGRTPLAGGDLRLYGADPRWVSLEAVREEPLAEEARDARPALGDVRPGSCPVSPTR